MNRRLILFLMIVTILCPMLSGCHGSKGLAPFTMPEEFDTSRNYEITFWAKNDTNKTQTKIYEKAIADFETLYPNITVNMRLYTDYNRIYNDVITNIATFTTPNVCITYPDHIATYLSGNNVVLPLDSLINDEKYGLGGSSLAFESATRSEIIPQFLSECEFAEHYYALPFMRSTEACYVNKTYVEALGYTLPETLTWDFIWEVSEAATKKNFDGTYILNGQNVMIPFIYKSTDNMMIQWLRQHGGGYSDASGNISIFNDTTEELLEAVADHAASGAFSTFKISSYPANFLNAGQCVFAIDSTAGATWMGSEAPLSDIAEEKIVHFETAVMTVPQYDVDLPQMISQGPSVCVFNKRDSQETLASWIFTQYLLTNDVQIAYAETEGYVPVTSKAQNSDEYKAYLSHTGGDDPQYYNVKLKASKLLLDNISSTFVTPVFNGSASLRDAAGQLIENVTKSVKRKETINATYIEKLYSDVTSLYRLNTTGGSVASGKAELGALPTASVLLLSALVLVWLAIVIYVVVNSIKNRFVKK